VVPRTLLERFAAGLLESTVDVLACSGMISDQLHGVADDARLHIT
jgi:hypothetical protein